MALKNNVRRSYAKPKPVHYHFGGFDIKLVPENHDREKWHTVRDGVDLGHFATVGAAVRAVRDYRRGKAT